MSGQRVVRWSDRRRRTPRYDTAWAVRGFRALRMQRRGRCAGLLLSAELRIRRGGLRPACAQTLPRRPRALAG